MLPFVPASFGDIVAAANIAHSIYKALSDSTGSSYEYQCLIEDVHSFEQALRIVELAISMSPPSGHLAQYIEAETTRCLELLKRFLEGIKSYQKALSGRGKGANSWRKIGWGLFKADEVASFREKLSQHKQNITVFLNGLTIIVGASYADETKQISASINEGFMALQKRLPRSVGYGDGNLVTLESPFGERLPLLWECCFSHKRLHEMLTTHFKGTCGEGHVERHDYSISTEDGRSLVQSGNWGSVVKKGTVLVMSMIVKKVALQSEDAGRQRNRCPRCYETDIGVMRDDGWLQCRRCKRRFSSEDRTVGLRDPPPPDKSVTEFRNIRILLVERSRVEWFEEALLEEVRREELLSEESLPEDLLEEEERRVLEWYQAEAEEANRFVEIS